MSTVNVNQTVSQQIFQILSKSPALTASLETLSAGDILKGRIQSLDNGLLLIKLLDGAAFTAKAPDGFSANPGDLITLMIGDKQNDQITAKIINDTQTNHKPNDENILISNIQNTLDSLGVINPERMVSKVIDLLKAEPEMPLDKAAFLTANNLPVDPELGEIINKISEHEFNLHENLKSLETGLIDSLSKMDIKESTTLLKPLLIGQAMDQIAADLKNQFPEAPSRLMDSITQKINELLTKTFMEETSGQESANIADAITKEAFEAILGTENLLQAAKGDPFSLSSDEAERLLKAVNTVLEDFHVKEGKLLKSDGEEVQKEIKDVIEKLFDKASIKVNNGVVEDINIKEKSKALKDIMEFTQKAMKQMDNSTRESNLPAFKEIDNAFRFFNQVTTYDSILQLPLKINREDSTGELYVMKRKNGRKKLDTENFTLFLSLKTSSLGLVESFLNATKKRITISFRVEDENLVKLVKDNYKALYDGLYEKGFILVDMKCRVIDSERINPFNAGAKAKELTGADVRLDIRV